MKILIVNGSPKGKNSVTLQTSLYLQALHPEHEFSELPVGQKIKSFERDFSPAREALEQADLILFSYPVYTFIAPYQLHRFIELIKENGLDLSGKFASQITTSKHFFDVTAHRFIEENCADLNIRVIRGLSADMEDLLSEEGQRQAEMFFQQLLFSCEHGPFISAPVSAPKREQLVYECSLAESPKRGKDIVIVTDCTDDDENLRNMIADFRGALPLESRIVNLRDFPFAGGCLGCLNCSTDGKCVYKDGFDTFLRSEIQNGDAIVYAFTISGHYAHSIFKCYDDRQFCNGHRTVTYGSPVAYIVSGDYRYENNLRRILEARAEVGGNYLCGVATDEDDTAKGLLSLAENLTFALESKLTRPANFYGVGGTKIFRDLIYVMQGMMKADHNFYKKRGIYDFPQKKWKTVLQMKFIGGLMSMPGSGEKIRKQMNQYIIAPYQKVIEAAKEQALK